MTYRVEIYTSWDDETEREEWAVVHLPTGVWYFPTVNTEQSARELCERLTQETS